MVGSVIIPAFLHAQTKPSFVRPQRAAIERTQKWPVALRHIIVLKQPVGNMEMRDVGRLSDVMFCRIRGCVCHLVLSQTLT